MSFLKFGNETCHMSLNIPCPLSALKPVMQISDLENTKYLVTRLYSHLKFESSVSYLCFM